MWKPISARLLLLLTGVRVKYNEDHGATVVQAEEIPILRFGMPRISSNVLDGFCGRSRQGLASFARS
jgi:hypothetical protein